MKKVTMVVHPYTARKDLGLGHDRYAGELIERLPSCGVDLEVFHSGHLKKVPTVLAAELLAIARLWVRRGKNLLHATASANAQAPLSAGRGPLVTTIHDLIWLRLDKNYDSSLKQRLKSRAIIRAAERSDALIVPFPSSRDYLIEKLGIPPERIRVIPLGVDHEQFYPLSAAEQLERPPYLAPQFKNILFVGSLTFGKGIDSLIRSFEEVVRSCPEARLVIGSSGWDASAIRKIWQDSPVRESIIFAGFIPEAELRAAYIYADITCFPSRYGFGLPTLESMACGTPTISGRTLDALDFTGDAGLLVDPDKHAEIAGAIVTLLGDASLFSTLKARGLLKSQEYHWQHTARQTAALYHEVG
jgi:glycosyltransferase involved in cell wall biosynthesis